MMTHTYGHGNPLTLRVPLVGSPSQLLAIKALCPPWFAAALSLLPTAHMMSSELLMCQPHPAGELCLWTPWQRLQAASEKTGNAVGTCFVCGSRRFLVLLPCISLLPSTHPRSTMTKTTRRERRKRAIASGAAEARGVSKKSAGLKHSSSSSKAKAATTGLVGTAVGKGGRRLVKRPATARKQKGGGGEAEQDNSIDRGVGGRKKKRPRSQVDEDDSGGEEEDGAPPLVEADELMATIQEHDQFFSRMLDMIPEHLVLPAKEVAESSYASKYMKVRKMIDRVEPLLASCSIQISAFALEVAFCSVSHAPVGGCACAVECTNHIIPPAIILGFTRVHHLRELDVGSYARLR